MTDATESTAEEYCPTCRTVTTWGRKLSGWLCLGCARFSWRFPVDPWEVPDDDDS